MTVGELCRFLQGRSDRVEWLVLMAPRPAAVWQLRFGGMTWRAIGARVGLTGSGAQQLAARAVAAVITKGLGWGTGAYGHASPIP